MESGLVVIGIDHRTATIGVRERFWISESRRCETLVELGRYDGIEELVVLATANSTEFIAWASDISVAANSVLTYLTRAYGLRLCDWTAFYRVFDQAALTHVFRIASGMDSVLLPASEVAQQVESAWSQAQRVGTTGRYLDAVFQKALSVSSRVRSETAAEIWSTLPKAAVVELGREVFGSLVDRRVLLLGPTRTSELCARYLADEGARNIRVLSHGLEQAQRLAQLLGGIAVPFDHRWGEMIQADLIISSTASPHLLLWREHAERLMEKRDGRRLCLIDLALPRDIDPAVREVKNVFLYDSDDLEQIVNKKPEARGDSMTVAEAIVAEEVTKFRTALMAERAVSPQLAFRDRLDELCLQELRLLSEQDGPFTDDQQRMLEELARRITRRVAAAFTRELKALPEKMEQDSMASNLERLFHSEQLRAIAARSQN